MGDRLIFRHENGRESAGAASFPLHQGSGDDGNPIPEPANPGGAHFPEDAAQGTSAARVQADAGPTCDEPAA